MVQGVLDTHTYMTTLHVGKSVFFQFQVQEKNEYKAVLFTFTAMQSTVLD